MKLSAVFENLPWLVAQAEIVADCARKAGSLEEYSGYATLRDALRNAVHGMQEIQRLSPDVRARIEGGLKTGVTYRITETNKLEEVEAA